MQGFLALLTRFRSDERGAFLVLFGVLAIVLVAASGAVVDFTAIEQAKARAQQALDSAALGLQPTIYNSPTPTDSSLKTKAQALLTERLNDNTITATVDDVSKNITDGTLNLEASVTVPTAFVQLVGIDSITARIVSEATRKKLNLEVAMVLDNSNSMSSDNRMTNLIDAATCAENILFNSDCDSTATSASNPNTKIGIVPFTLAVNVGTGNASASWMDRTGTAGSRPARPNYTYDASDPPRKSVNITDDNFDDDNDDATLFTGTVDRIALMDQLTNVSWGGCVEARVPPYDTTDDAPVAGTDTMFTPYFAPDEPDSGSFSNNYLSDTPSSCKAAPKYVWTQTMTSCDRSGSSSRNYDRANCVGSTTNTYQTVSPTGVVSSATSSRPATLPTSPGTNDDPGSNSYDDDYSYSRSGSGTYRYTNTRVRTWTYQYSARELQERLCKYTNATVSSPSQGSVHGPNGDCPTNAIQPLTDSKSAINSAITDLSPQGGTNIHAGVAWGFRVLSPGEPFTQGNPYDSGTAKVMIVMTDGENTAYTNSRNMNDAEYYGAYGYPWNQRNGTIDSDSGDIEDEMDTRTVSTCDNAKQAGIKIYTVGLATGSTSDPDKVEQMLKDCSSGEGYYYFPAQSSDLTSVFTEIASQLANLRLAK